MTDRPDVQPELGMFLSAVDLDVLLEVAEQITEVDTEGAAALIGIVTSWTDTQAVANLLMYPGLLPPGYRIPALLRGLATDFRHYVTLAAVVGLRRFRMPDEYRRAVGHRLIDLVAFDSEPISSLASATLAPFVYDVDVGRLLASFDAFGETARHNVLVAMIDEFGIGDTRRHAETALRNDLIDERVAAEIERRLTELEAESGGMLLLTPIPNSVEWSNRPQPAPYLGA